MCGICGIALADNREKVPPSFLSSMCQTLTHRGPDDQGFFIQKNAGLGARRLSVIDLESGHQPLANEDSSIHIVHDGEIYNFPDLQTELKSRGHTFRTKSDTETIVHCYEEWGDDFVRELRGMFAFALWDERARKLILARDRIGIKPLYYTLLENRTLVFASELKAILIHPKVKRVLEPRALDLFLTLEYIPSPLSIFKTIHKLPPGHILIYKRGQAQIKKYWDIEPGPKTSRKISKAVLPSLADKLYSLLKESVQMRLISDVPLGAFLSGGIDSSSIVGLMNELGVSPLRTFSIGFEESSYSELDHARRIAQKFDTVHEEFILRPRIVDIAEKLIRHLDEPLGDFSIFPTYLVSKMARSHVKVILSGDGGDEIFGGYEHYQAQKLSEFPLPSLLQKNLPAVVKKLRPSAKKKGAWNKFRRYTQGLEYNPLNRHLRWMMFFTPRNKKNLYSKDLTSKLEGIKETYEMDPFQKLFHNLNRFDPVSGELYLDLKSYLTDDILAKIDRMSMAASLETRVPLLDHKIVEFLFKLPGNLKLRGLTTKWIFKKAMERLLPSPTIHRRKEGFSIPIKNWLRRELKDLMFDYLNESRIKADRLFNFEYIKKMTDSHLSGRENYSHQLWALLVFEIWKEQYL
jgi:asparagine synthase (glutamine-hydrolysing)